MNYILSLNEDAIPYFPFLDEGTLINQPSENNSEVFPINNSFYNNEENLISNNSTGEEDPKIQDFSNISQNSKFVLYDFNLKKNNDFATSIFRFSKKLSSSSKKNEISPIKLLFQVRRKRGQYTGNLNKIHDSSSFDNLQTKIQVHFFSFIIDISNDALLSFFGNNSRFHFKDISYKVKKAINFKSCHKYKNSTIKDILQNEISSKFKRFPKDINIITLNEVCNLSDRLNKFFNQKYMELFQTYYNQERPLKEFLFEGEKIVLSKKTKTFYDLLNKYKKNQLELKEAVKTIYFNGYNSLIGKDSFIVKKSKFY